jgi:hypothetical protein
LTRIALMPGAVQDESVKLGPDLEVIEDDQRFVSE